MGSIRHFINLAEWLKRGLPELETWERCAKIFSLIAAPIILGMASCAVQQSVSQKSADVAYTQLAISILTEQPGNKNSEKLRGWATNVLEATSPVEIPRALKDELRKGTSTFPVEVFGRFNSEQLKSDESASMYQLPYRKQEVLNHPKSDGRDTDP